MLLLAPAAATAFHKTLIQASFGVGKLVRQAGHLDPHVPQLVVAVLEDLDVSAAGATGPLRRRGGGLPRK